MLMELPWGLSLYKRMKIALETLNYKLNVRKDFWWYKTLVELLRIGYISFKKMYPILKALLKSNIE